MSEYRPGCLNELVREVSLAENTGPTRFKPSPLVIVGVGGASIVQSDKSKEIKGAEVRCVLRNLDHTFRLLRQRSAWKLISIGTFSDCNFE